MAWLRLDDGFTKHPKFEGWPPSQRWAWLEVMEYCARYRTRGRIPTDETLLPRSSTKTLLAKAERAGWCARGDDGALWINDWETFNPPRGEDDIAASVRVFFTENPQASANDAVKAIGGGRNAVLAAVKRYRTGTATGTETGTAGGSGGTEPVPQGGIARASTRVPVPSRPEVPPKAVALGEDPEPSLDDDPQPNSNGGGGDAAYDEHGTAWDYESIPTPILREMP